MKHIRYIVMVYVMVICMVFCSGCTSNHNSSSDLNPRRVHSPMLASQQTFP